MSNEKQTPENQQGHAPLSGVGGSAFDDLKDCELREALTLLRDLADIQNGAPLVQHEQEWEEIMERTYDLLAKYES